MKKVFLLFAAVAMSVSAMAQFSAQGNSHLTVTVKDSEDPANVPFEVSFSTDKNLKAIEGKIYTNEAKLVMTDEDEETYLVRNNDLFPKAASKGKWNIYESVQSEYFYFSLGAEDAVKAIAANNFAKEGVAFTGVLNASSLADGEYKLTFKDVIFTDIDTDALYAIVGNGAQTTTLDVPFTVEGGQVKGGTKSGVKGVVIDEETAQKSIYNIQGMKIRQTVPGRLYIVNGKKVIAQ